MADAMAQFNQAFTPEYLVVVAVKEKIIFIVNRETFDVAGGVDLSDKPKILVNRLSITTEVTEYLLNKYVGADTLAESFMFNTDTGRILFGDDAEKYYKKDTTNNSEYLN